MHPVHSVMLQYARCSQACHCQGVFDGIGRTLLKAWSLASLFDSAIAQACCWDCVYVCLLQRHSVNLANSSDVDQP